MPKKSIVLNFLIFLILLFGCNQVQTASSRENVADIIDSFNNAESGKILIAAHRALHITYPENSLAAISHAIEKGVDIIEVDVRSTKDGILILMHDSKIDRTTNGTGSVDEFLFEDIKKFNLLNNESQISSEKIPTLKEALLLAKDKIMVDIDIKGAPVKTLTEVVDGTQTKHQVIFFDSEFEVLDSLLVIDSTYSIMPRARSSMDVDMILSRYNPRVIHIDDGFYNQSVVNKIRENKSRIWINALGQPDNIVHNAGVDSAYLALATGGANIIQTDLPLILLKYLESKGFR